MTTTMLSFRTCFLKLRRSSVIFSQGRCMRSKEPKPPLPPECELPEPVSKYDLPSTPGLDDGDLELLEWQKQYVAENICEEEDEELPIHVCERTPKRGKFSITTPIFYVNSAPHIGHLYTAVLADVVQRWYKILNYETHFITGTDEHGLKIQQAAEARGETPANFCLEVSGKFENLFNHSVVQYDEFIRTSEARHKLSVFHIWNKLKANGYIYKGSYEGWYCTSDETFLTDSEILEINGPDGKPQKVSSESKQPVHWTKEENYMFRLSEFGPRLNKWLDKKVIKPDIFESLVRNWIAQGLPDLSISRQRDRLQWGIQVPSDPTQTIYVWLDALVNYLSGVGYPNEPVQWPPNIQIIGKDILRFHALYWPAFLMAVGLELPERIQVHSHWKVNDVKMSKSLGNVVDPMDRMNVYSVDGLRYFLMREGVPHNDGNWNDKKVVELLNAELANTLGNLFARCTAPSINIGTIYPPCDREQYERNCTKQDRELVKQLHILPELVDQHYRDCNIYKALDAIMAQLRDTNAFFQRHKPWELLKNPEQEAWLHTILHITIDTLRVVGILLQPVTPLLSGKMMLRLQVPVEERTWDNIQPLNALKGGICKYENRKLGTVFGGVLFPKIKL